MAWLIHSKAGSTWKKHKYIKKIGNRYYYESDLENGRKKSQAQYLARYNAKKVQDSMEENTPDGDFRRQHFQPGTPIYFDADHPGTNARTQDNLNAIRRGDWNGYADERMRKAVYWNNQAKEAEKRQTSNGGNVDARAKKEYEFYNSVEKGKEKVAKMLKGIKGLGKKKK